MIRWFSNLPWIVWIACVGLMGGITNATIVAFFGRQGMLFGLFICILLGLWFGMLRAEYEEFDHE